MSTEVSINSPEDIIIAKNTNTGEEYYVIIEQDEEGCDWIQDECPVGHLITWHREYRIGEKHKFDDPIDFFRDLIQTRFSGWNKSKEEKAEIERKYFDLLLDYANVTIVPREEIQKLEAYKKHPQPYYADNKDAPYFLCRLNKEGNISDWPYSDGMSTDNPNEFTEDDKYNMWEILYDLKFSELRAMAMNIPDIVIYPVFLYDHSGIALSLTNEWPFNDRWDAGQIGWWWISKEETANWDSPDDWRHVFYNQAKEAIEEFNLIESGNTWGFVSAPRKELDSFKDCVNEYSSGLWSRRLREAISDHREDSCYGYVGDYEALVKDYCSDQDLEIIGVVE